MCWSYHLSYLILIVLHAYICIGSIIPRKQRLRRSSKLMAHDPFTLVIAPDASHQAVGQVYIDDEITLAHELHQAFIWRELLWQPTSDDPSSQGAVSTGQSMTLTNRRHPDSTENTSSSAAPFNTVERLLILGQSTPPRQVTLEITSNKLIESDECPSKIVLEFTYESSTGVLTVKKPDVRIADDWTIVVEY